MIKTLSKKKLDAATSRLKQPDSLHKLNRPEQVKLFRLRTGHNRFADMCKVGESMQRRHHEC